MKWKRLDRGEYESSDGRFHILHSGVRVGHEWVMIDHRTPNYYKAISHHHLLRHAKEAAEARVRGEKLARGKSA